MSLFSNIWEWLKKEFTHITSDLDKVAIAVTQQIKNAVDSPEAGFVAKIYDGLRHTGVAEEILGIVKLAAGKALALELAMQMPAGDVSEEQFLEWEKRVLSALNLHPDKAVVYTRVATTILRDVLAFTQNGKSITFAEGVLLVEDAYQASKEIDG